MNVTPMSIRRHGRRIYAVIIIPYKTDAHDGIFRLIAPSIMVICTIIQFFITCDNKRIEAELNVLGAKVKEQAYQTPNVSFGTSVESSDQWDLFETDELTASEADSIAAKRAARKLKQATIRQEGKFYTDLDWCTVLDSLDIDHKAELIEDREIIINSYLMKKLAFIPAKFNFIKLFTSMFTHGDWIHLIGNMLFFYLCGVTLERFWGGGKFLILYLLFGIIASLTNTVWDAAFGRNLEIMNVGASGAIAGLMGAFLVTHRNTNVHCIWLIVFWPKFFQVPAGVYMIFWFLGQVLYMLLDARTNSGNVGGVAFCAHVSGFLAGMLAGRLVKSENQEAVAVDTPRGSIRKPLPIPGQAAPSMDIEPGNDDLPNASDQQSGQPSFNQGWQAFERKSYVDAAQIIGTALSNLFLSPRPEVELIHTHLQRVLKEWKTLPIHPNQYYEWAKALMQLNDHLFSIQCFDLAAFKSQNQHIKTNSLFRAAKLRIELGMQIEKAQRDLVHLVRTDPQSPVAWEAKNLLVQMKKNSASPHP